MLASTGGMTMRDSILRYVFTAIISLVIVATDVSISYAQKYMRWTPCTTKCYADGNKCKANLPRSKFYPNPAAEQCDAELKRCLIVCNRAGQD
jgi:hypothetical protein